MTVLMGLLILISLQGCGNSSRSVDENSVRNAGNEPKDIGIYRSFDEMEHRLSQKNDTVYVINFWATWCKPCVEEMPYFEQLHDEFEGKPVKILLVSLDFEEQLETKLKPFVSDRNLKPEVVLLLDPDANTWIPKVDPSWGGAIPVTLIYKNEKRIFVDQRFPNYKSLKDHVVSMM